MSDSKARSRMFRDVDPSHQTTGSWKLPSAAAANGTGAPTATWVPAADRPVTVPETLAL